MLFKSRHNYMIKQILFDMYKEILCDTIKESSTSNIIKKKTPIWPSTTSLFIKMILPDASPALLLLSLSLPMMSRID